MHAVYLETFNDIYWCNKVYLNDIDPEFKITENLGRFYDNIWDLVRELQKFMNIEPSPTHDMFWDNTLTRKEMHEELGWIK